ncbi:MAG: carboxypeptidase-like regulatory domain-containing protein [Saprospiraceae bacterium]|nr:carboxypeptidase-like regulatory domain-containing protein [Saprospiraceae bacterium]
MRYTLTILGLLVVTSVMAQKLEGTVTDSVGTPLSGASVVLLDSLDQILSYAFADQRGHWSIALKKEPRLLKVNYLAFKELILPISKDDYQDSLHVVLFPINNKLEEVIIDAKRITRVENGDTTIYNLQHYKSETDETFGDVLSKVPGFEVTPDGQINYNGKRVDQLLIEDKDILNNQHGLASEQLRAEDIQKVEIIKNYKPFKARFSKSWSDQVALNLVLSENSKGKWNGNISMAAGYDSRYESELTLMKVNSSFGHTSFIRSNNLGEPTISIADFLALQSNLLESLKKTTHIDDLIPEGFKKEGNEQENVENLLASNSVLEIKENTTAKFSVLGSYFDRTANAALHRAYIRSNDLFKGDEHTSLQLPYLSAALNTQSTLNAKTTLEIELPFAYFQNNQNTQTLGNLNDRLWSSDWKNNLVDQNINPQVYWNHQASGEHLLSISGQFLSQKKTEDIVLSLPDSLDVFSNSFSPQQNKERHSELDINTSWEFTPGKFRLISYLNFKRINHSIIYSDSSDLTTQNQLNGTYKNSVFEPQIKLAYQTKKILLKYHVKFRKESPVLLGTPSVFGFWSHEFAMRYNFARLHFLLLKGVYEERVNNPILSLKNYQLINDHSVLVYDLPFGKVNRKRGLLLNHFWFDTFSGRRLFSSLSINQQDNPIVFTTQNNGFYLIQRPRIAQQQKIFEWTTWWTQPLFDSKFKVNIEGRFNSTATLENDQRTVFERLIFKFNLKSNFQKKVNLSLGYSFSNNRQTTAISTFQFITQQLSGDIRFKSGSFLFQSDANLIWNTNNRQQQYFLLWNSNLGYSISEKWRLKLTFRDILNLKPNQIFDTSIDWMYQEVRRFNRFSGSIVFGGEYRF